MIQQTTPSTSTERVPVQRIVLTGFMGSGKSTVGLQLAHELGWTFLDVDDVIVEETGMPISQFFALHGEPAFREREHSIIARLCNRPNLVLALGGGAIESEVTRQLLLTGRGTLVVHLQVELSTTLARCRGTEHIRPVLADGANLAARYAKRLPLYAQSHVSIAVDALTPQQVVKAIRGAAGLQSR